MPMTREAVRTLLGENASKETIDALLDMHSQSIGADKSRISELEMQLAEANEAKSTLAAEAEDRMSAQEKADKALKDAMKAAQNAERRLARMAAEREFTLAGISGDDVEGLLDLVGSGNEEQARANAKRLADVIAARSKAAGEKARLDALASTPQPQPGEPTNGTGGMSREQFNALSYDEQIAMKEKDPDILKKLH